MILILVCMNVLFYDVLGFHITYGVNGVLQNNSIIYYMDKYCVEPLILDSRDAIRMSLWSTMHPPSTFTCTVRVQNRKYETYGICLTFKSINMTSKNNGSCLESRLDLFGGFGKRLSGKCLQDEFKCVNTRCIKNNSVCDGYNNCGDDSDEKSCNKGSFSLTLAAIIGIAVGGAVIIAIGIIVICCFWCCKYCSYERI